MLTCLQAFLRYRPILTVGGFALLCCLLTGIGQRCGCQTKCRHWTSMNSCPLCAKAGCSNELNTSSTLRCPTLNSYLARVVQTFRTRLSCLFNDVGVQSYQQVASDVLPHLTPVSCRFVAGALTMLCRAKDEQIVSLLLGHK